MYNSGLKIFAPASISNLNVGFDILGVALENLGDEVIVRDGKKPGVQLSRIFNGKSLSLDTSVNIAAYSAQAMLNHLGLSNLPVEMTLIKNMKIGTGLGSSASSAAAGVMALNEYLNTPLEKRALIPFAMAGERLHSPTAPADNVVASLIGGMTLITNIEDFSFQRLYLPAGLVLVIILPDKVVLTGPSRKNLPASIGLTSFVKQSSRLASFIFGLQNSDFDLIRQSLVDDIIEPTRKSTIPHFDRLKNLALENGALGFGISGSGPAMFALCHNTMIAEKIIDASRVVFVDADEGVLTYMSNVNSLGAVRC